MVNLGFRKSVGYALSIGGIAIVNFMLGLQSAHATVVYGIRPATGSILAIDPTNGSILNSFATPAAISSTQDFAGLTYANQLGELLYINTSSSSNLFRLNPNTGATLGTVNGDAFTTSGLSFQQNAAVNYVFYGHEQSDLHRQTGLGGATSFFWATGRPTAGLGGDGYGREFGIFTDGQIHEYNPFVNTPAFLSGFAAPAGSVGLAFDGINLFVSTISGNLLTLNPNTGAILNRVSVPGGTLVELGARFSTTAIPEPATATSLGILFLSLCVLRRKKSI